MNTREEFEKWKTEASLYMANFSRCADPGFDHEYEMPQMQAAWQAWQAAAKAEREACAKVCENRPDPAGKFSDQYADCAKAIRMRANV
jgi:hypothetical protein